MEIYTNCKFFFYITFKVEYKTAPNTAPNSFSKHN